jgi:hypothetical protein
VWRAFVSAEGRGRLSSSLRPAGSGSDSPRQRGRRLRGPLLAQLELALPKNVDVLTVEANERTVQVPVLEGRATLTLE